jgi:hypothetical protein
MFIFFLGMLAGMAAIIYICYKDVWAEKKAAAKKLEGQKS